VGFIPPFSGGILITFIIGSQSNVWRINCGGVGLLLLTAVYSSGNG